MTFLPKDYEMKEAESKYMRLEPGENRFRVMGSSIVGQEFWVGKQPQRRKINEQIHPDDLDPEKPKIKEFWAFPVYDYKDSRIKILELTQKSIMRTIKGLAEDEDWGSPKEYDLVIVKTGEMLETRYEVKPKPKKKMDDGIIQMYKDTHINLEALFSGDDPFANEIDMDEVAEALGA